MLLSNNSFDIKLLHPHFEICKVNTKIVSIITTATRYNHAINQYK